MKYFSLTLVLLLVLSAGAVWAADSGVRFSGLTGQVSIRPEADEEAWRGAGLKSVINLYDHVKTAEDSSAILSFADMTTFVMKPESEVIIDTPPEKDSKVKLVMGKVWVNVKKMMKDGTMEVQMSQAVAGIKGTNITCESNKEGTENEIACLRGQAEIMIRETAEKLALNEGEMIKISAGGKVERQEVDVQEIQQEWKENLQDLGDKIEMNEIPELLRGIKDSEMAALKGLKEELNDLLGAETQSEDSIFSFRKSVDRFLGVIVEDLAILGGMAAKVDKAQGTEGLSNADRVKLGNYSKWIGEARTTIQTNQGEAAKLLTTQFVKAASSEEAQMIRDEVAGVWEPIDNLLRELSTYQPGNQPFSWFMDAIRDGTDATGLLNGLAAKNAQILEKNPQDVGAQENMKLIAVYQVKIETLLRDVNIFDVPAGSLTELEDYESAIGNYITSLRDLIHSYDATVKSATPEVRLTAAVHVMSAFTKARRTFQKAERLFNNVKREISKGKFITSEQQDFLDTYQRISDSYQGIEVVDQLSASLANLEDQLRDHL